MTTALQGQRILVTGPAGQIAFPLAARLARDNEVWGIARFSDPATRTRCDDAGIRTQVVDLADPDWSGLPEHFDYVLHLAAAIVPGLDFDASLRINAEGTGYVMSRFRDARACLMMSTSGVYAPPEDGAHPVAEGDPLGISNQPYAPTYCVSKIGQEAVARFVARDCELPTTIARMNAAYGPNGGFPAMVVDMILADQPIPLPEGRAAVCCPIHDDDIFDQTPALLEAAAVPATITNWAGDENLDVRDLAGYIGELVGKQPRFATSPDGIVQFATDPARRRELTGPCKVTWRDGVRRMIAGLHPEIELR